MLPTQQPAAGDAWRLAKLYSWGVALGWMLAGLGGCATSSPSSPTRDGNHAAPQGAQPSTSGAPQTAQTQAVGLEAVAVQVHDTLRPPATLSTAQLEADIALLRYAIDQGYGGRDFIDRALFDDVMRSIEALSTAGEPRAFCDALGHQLARLPDAHLSARIGRERCGPGPGARRPPRVGPNLHPADSSAHWSFERRTLEERDVAVFTLRGFPAGDDPRWRGFDEAVTSALEADAVVVDLRGNGGGDDTRGYQLASALLGAEVPPGYATSHQRTTPEAIQLMLNWTAVGLIGAAEQTPRGPAPHIPAYFVELKHKQLAALRGALDEVERKDNDALVLPAQLAFEGPVLVLADAACASSCESTLEALRQHPRARFVGENTGGFIHFGNGGLLVLHHSQVAVYLPTKYNAYADGSFFDKVGFAPDVPVAPGEDAFDHARALLRSSLVPQAQTHRTD